MTRAASTRPSNRPVPAPRATAPPCVTLARLPDRGAAALPARPASTRMRVPVPRRAAGGFEPLTSTVSISRTISDRKVPIDGKCYARRAFSGRRSASYAYRMLPRNPAQYGDGWRGYVTFVAHRAGAPARLADATGHPAGR